MNLYDSQILHALHELKDKGEVDKTILNKMTRNQRLKLYRSMDSLHR